MSTSNLQPAAKLPEPASRTLSKQLEIAELHRVDETESLDAQHGAVFTRRWVVELILDLAGYEPSRDLADLVAIEPACGEGAFLVPMVERLVSSCQLHGRDLREASGAIRAYDLQGASVQRSKYAVASVLSDAGYIRKEIDDLVDSWVSEGDFLLQQDQHPDADFVLGNPPYVRLEAVPDARCRAYRRACVTMSGRADLYVGFYEVGLRSLKPDGTLAFICADRWMRNQYGRALRQFVSDHFSIEVAVEMHNVDAFAEEVSAYPSIVVIKRGKQNATVIAEATAGFDEAEARDFLLWHRGRKKRVGRSYRAARVPSWFSGADPWPAGSPARLLLLRELEQNFQPLEDAETGTRVGIGVATGADRVFVTRDRNVVESDRLLPLAMARDTASGELKWSGHYLVNPWSHNGQGLVELEEFPKLRSYFEANVDALRGRHVAQRHTGKWYRTIDRVDHALTERWKLLFPDIKASSRPVLDRGNYCPHHNLYFVVSDKWDLEVLGGLLLSRVAQLFVESYAVRMRGGYLRFQAQYLRRIRVPYPDDIGAQAADELRKAFRIHDVDTATKVALRIYGITEIPS